MIEITDGLSIAIWLLLALAAWRDIATRIIPNQICALIGIIGVGARAFIGPEAVGLSLAMSLAVFLLLLIPRARGMLGGGDVKLIAATLVGLSPGQAYGFVVAMTLAGGILAAAHLFVRFLPAKGVRVAPRNSCSLRRVLAVERWRVSHSRSLPYGVAIAVGGIWASRAVFLRG